MTREEAIKELEILKEDYWYKDGYGRETKAIDMAISALQEECTFVEKEREEEE